jgi:hypothetical protein
MIVFEDAQLMTAQCISKIRHDSPTFRKVSKLDHSSVSEAYACGGLVNVFDLLELLCKPSYRVLENQIAHSIIENLKPGYLITKEL